MTSADHPEADSAEAGSAEADSAEPDCAETAQPKAAQPEAARPALDRAASTDLSQLSGPPPPSNPAQASGSAQAPALSPTARSTIQRGSKHARQDRADLLSVLDAGLFCHLAMLIDDSPRIVPTGYGRIGNTLYLHGSSGARSMRAGAEGPEICVSVTLVDGVVYARSVFHNSINYRSAILHGRCRKVDDPDEKWRALRALTDKLAPGSWEHARPPTKRELAATSVLALDLDESAVKIRSGGPDDDAEDIEASDAWAGVLPLHSRWGEPIPSSDLAAEVPTPSFVTARKASPRE